jgi:Cdc6-like AAA superfamily ATPase
MVGAMNLIGLETQIREIKEFIQNWKKGNSLLLIGSSGTGKTASIKQVCEELKYGIWEIDYTDINFEDLMKKCKLKPIYNMVIIIDNIDELPESQQSKLIKIIKESNIPIIMTAYKQYQVNEDLLKICKVIQFYKPKAGDMLKLVNEVSKQLNLKPNYQALKGDFRQALYSVFGSQGYESEESLMQIIKNYFNNLKLEEINDKILITILDNSHRFYGFYIYLLVKSLAVSDFTKRPEPLKLNELKYSGSIIPSYFYEKLRISSSIT